MDTEKVFMLHGQNTEFSFTQLSDDESSSAKRHVELMRHLQEIRQLYLMFQYCLDSIDSKYTLMSNGNLRIKGKNTSTEEDYIAINALTNSLISSGRTLVEAMECYVRENYSEADAARKEFMDHLHSIYDSSFSYRFLIRMRDYSQHGHLPVNQNGEWFGFDLYQVLNKPHFKHNGKIKQQLEKSVQEVRDVYGDLLRLSLAMTIAEFTAYLLDIYKQFWKNVFPSINDSAKAFSELIVRHPENVNVLGKGQAALFVYDVDDSGMAHVVFTNDDAEKMLSIFQSEAEAVANRYMTSWNQLKEGTLTYRVINESQIEIGTM